MAGVVRDEVTAASMVATRWMAVRRAVAENRARAALWIIAILLGVRMAIFVGGAVSRPSHGFVAHYAASRLVAEGADVARFYDDDWFKAQVARFEPTVVDLYGANLPTTALLVLPLTILDYNWARAVWSFASFLLLVWTVIWLARRAGLEGSWTPAFLCFLFLYQPAYENLLHAQMYVLALALLTVAWHGYRSARPSALGGALGILLVAKSAALVFWPLIIVQRRWREFVWGVGTVSAVVIGSLPLLGIDAWRNYFDVAALLTSRSFLSVTAYQTQLGLIRHLFVYDPLVNPTPLFNLPAVGMLLPWVVFAVALGASAALAYRRRHSDLIFAAFAALSLILSPVSLDYHYTIALLPIALLLSKLQRRMLSWEGLLLIVGALLIAADLPYRSPKLADGAWALLAYPKLYGALLLWGLALTCSIHEPGSSMPSRGRQFET